MTPFLGNRGTFHANEPNKKGGLHMKLHWDRKRVSTTPSPIPFGNLPVVNVYYDGLFIGSIHQDEQGSWRDNKSKKHRTQEEAVKATITGCEFSVTPEGWQKLIRDEGGTIENR